MAASKYQKERIRAQLARQRRRARVPQGVESPEFEEDRFARDIQRVTVNRVNSLIRERIFPLLDSLLTDSGGLVDNNSRDAIRELNTLLRPFLPEILAQINLIAGEHVERTNTHHEVAFINEFDKAIGVDLSSILSNRGLDRKLRAATRRSVDLIKRIPKRYLARVRAVIQQGFKTGSDAFSIKKSLMEIAGIEKRHAKLIARDQTAKLTSALNRFRQQDIGITSYVWRTVGDESVRPTHANNNRKSFLWTSPPSETGHPGNDVQCRCVADPDLSGFFGKEEIERRLEKRPVK